MPEQITLPRLTIQYRDPFIFKTLYFLAHEWLKENDYLDEDRGITRFEKNYEEQRIKDVRHYRIWWRTFRIPHGSSFVKYKINLNYLGLVIQQVEIMQEGKRIKAQSGEINLFIEGIIEVDFKDHFKKNFIMRGFEDVFKTRWMKNQLEGHKEELKRDVNRFHGTLKTWFELQHSMPVQKMYHTKFDKV